MKGNFKDYMSAVKKGSREAELEDQTGWYAIKKVHKSKKQYSRKNINISLTD